MALPFRLGYSDSRFQGVTTSCLLEQNGVIGTSRSGLMAPLWCTEVMD